MFRTINNANNTSSIIEDFLSNKDVRESSKSTYRRQLKRFLDWLEKKEILAPTRQDVLQYRQELLDEGLAPITASAYILAVQHLYSWLESEGISENIASGIKMLRQPKGFRKDALSLNQAHTLLDAFDLNTIQGLRDYAIVNLMIRTGIREIEIIRADIGDVRQTAGETVLYIQGKGMNSKDEIVILTDETLTPIQQYLKQRCSISEYSPLFGSLARRNVNKRLTTRSISRIVKDTLRSIGIDSNRITAHSLRHSAVTFCLLNGGSVQEACTLARHRNIQTTMIYAHNIDRIKNAPERRIDDFLRKPA